MAEASTPADRLSKRKWLTVGEIKSLLSTLEDADVVSLLPANWIVIRDGDYLAMVDFWSQEKPFLEMETLVVDIEVIDD